MAYHPAVPLPPSPMPMVGHETAAAVNLLSMSIREADLAASRAAAAGAYAHRSSPPALTAEQHQQVCTASCLHTLLGLVQNSATGNNI